MNSPDSPLRARDLFAGGFLSASDFAGDAEAELPAQIGPYRVLARLGEGGTATVFRVDDPERGCEAALKLLKAEAVESSAYARFWREAEALARVQHRSVVRVHVLGESEDGPYLVQELVEGETLAAICARSPVPPQQAARWVRELADAVEAIHAVGVVHRDLKPQNVMIQDGIPVLLDFGIARDLDAERLTQTGAVLGTPAYMAPEQARGGAHAAGPTADVYGLGCLLYTLLTGAPPFEGSVVQVLNAVLHRDPVPPRARRREVPRGLDAICRRALAKDPGARYPSAAAMRDDLDRVLAGRRPRALGRWWGSALLAGGALAFLVLAIVLAARPSDPPSDAPGPRPATRPAPTAARPLWSGLRADAPFGFKIRYHERGLGMALRLDVEFEAVPRQAPDGWRSDVVVQAIAAEFAQENASGLGVRFDSRAPPQPTHPLAAMRRAVGMHYAFTLDPATGAVSDLSGMTPIARAVERLTGPPTPLLAPQTYRRFCRRAFSDAFIAGALGTLMQPRGADRPLPWRPAGALSFRLPAGTIGRAALTPLSPGWVAEASDRYRLRGEARYAEGVLRDAWVEQVRAEAGRAAQRRASWIRWSFSLRSRTAARPQGAAGGTTKSF